MEDPKTPDKFQICSTRSWTGQVRCWRRKLHEWDPPSGEKDDIFALVSKRYVTKIQHLIWILKHLEYCSKLPWLETQAPSWSRVKIANVGSKEYKMWTYITTSHYFSPICEGSKSNIFIPVMSRRMWSQTWEVQHRHHKMKISPQIYMDVYYERSCVYSLAHFN